MPEVPTQSSIAELAARFGVARSAVAAAQSAATKLDALQPELDALRRAHQDASERHRVEAEDVARLEGWSMRRIASSLGRTRLSELERERAEAQATAYELAVAHERLQQAEAHARELERVAGTLSKATEECTRRADEFALALMVIGDTRAARLRQIAEEAAVVENELREISEAQAAAAHAESVLRSAWSHLSKAHSWSTYDTFFGGGFFADLAKYDRIEEATQQMRAADQAMRRLSVELADVGMGAARGVEVTEMTRTFDIWFDNIFTDWAVRNRIEEAAGRLADSVKSLVTVTKELGERRAVAERRRASLAADRDQLLEEPNNGLT